MAWPPAALPTNRTNATPQQDTHPGDHNALAQAINDTVGRVQALGTFQGVGLAAPNQQVGAQAQPAAQWTTEAFDTAGFHSTGEWWSIPAGMAGTYSCIATVSSNPAVATGVGVGVLTIDRAAGSPSGAATWITYIPAGNALATLQVVFRGVVGDQYHVRYYNPNLSAVAVNFDMQMIYIGP